MGVLGEFLSSTPPCRWERHAAVRWALDRFAPLPRVGTVSEVTDAVGLSATRFVDVFRREVGLTPKVFCRVRRFQAALQRIEEDRRPPRWAELAVACGYSDQAHLVREFRSLSGYTPTEYLACRTDRLDHLRDED